jgi:hypothetical protein
METIDLSKDEFFMRNHLGQMECKLCLTLHPTEGQPPAVHPDVWRDLDIFSTY